MLKRIEIINIQSHKNTIIPLKPGLNVLKGDNNAGKSAVLKSLYKVIDGKLSKPNVRRALVRRGAGWGEFRLVRDDDARLIIHIDTEASGTYVEYDNPNDNLSIRRHITTDRNVDELLTLFGIHVDKENKISINVHSPSDKLLLVETPSKLNGALIKGVITDQNAEIALENIAAYKPKHRQFDTQIRTIITSLIEQMNAIKLVDEEKYYADADMCDKFATVIEALDASKYRVDQATKLIAIDTTMLEIDVDDYVVEHTENVEINTTLIDINTIDYIVNKVRLLTEINMGLLNVEYEPVPKVTIYRPSTKLISINNNANKITDDARVKLSNVVNIIDSISNAVCPVCKRGYL